MRILPTGVLRRVDRSLEARAPRAWSWWIRCRARWRGQTVVHMLHVSKTGGSAVRAALHEHRHSGPCVLVHHPHRTVLADIPRGEATFLFLRDPTSRFVSAFNGRRRRGRPRFDHPWTPQEERAFERFETANDLALALSSPDTDLRTAAQQAMRDIVHVRSPQVAWVDSEEYLRERADDLLLVGRQERLEQDFDRLRDLLGLHETVQLPTDATTANRSPHDADRALDDEAVANIEAWYADDLRLLEVVDELRRREPRGSIRAYLTRRSGGRGI